MIKTARLSTMTPLLGGIVTAAVLILAFLFTRQSLLDRAVEPARDLMLRGASAFVRKTATMPRIVVVDIDSQSLESVALWPWPREIVASLVEAVAAAGPSVVAIDILFENADTHSPAALARQLGARLGRSDLTSLATTLPDGDKRLSAALRSTPSVLGLVLDPSARASVAAPPIIARGQVDLPNIWSGAGVVAPPGDLIDAAQGLGALSLPGDATGIVRRVPLLVAADGRPFPGLALEIMRVAGGASNYIVDGASRSIQVGEARFPLAQDAMLRLAPVDGKDRAVTVVPAADVMLGRVDPAVLAKSIVMIGGSAPELGGLRSTSLDPLTPSVQIHAHALMQLMRGYIPHPPASAFAIRVASLCAAALLALVVTLWLRPLTAALSIAALAALIWLAAIALAASPQLLIDPLLPTVSAFAVFGMVLLLDFAVTQQREARVRQRFEQHLAPQVVSLIVEDPNLV